MMMQFCGLFAPHSSSWTTLQSERFCLYLCAAMVTRGMPLERRAALPKGACVCACVYVCVLCMYSANEERVKGS